MRWCSRRSRRDPACHSGLCGRACRSSCTVSCTTCTGRPGCVSAETQSTGAAGQAGRQAPSLSSPSPFINTNPEGLPSEATASQPGGQGQAAPKRWQMRATLRALPRELGPPGALAPQPPPFSRPYLLVAVEAGGVAEALLLPLVEEVLQGDPLVVQVKAAAVAAVGLQPFGGPELSEAGIAADAVHHAAVAHFVLDLKGKRSGHRLATAPPPQRQGGEYKR